VHTLAKGARQLVVHEALETTWSLSGLYLSSFTPITNMGAACGKLCVSICVTAVSMLCSHTYQIETNFQMRVVPLECSHGARSHNPSELSGACCAADDTHKRTHPHADSA